MLLKTPLLLAVFASPLAAQALATSTEKQATTGTATAELWSLEPIARPPVPPVATERWSKGPIDRFVLARLEREGLVPTRDASPAAWLRRVSFDLVGLPPSPEAIAAFQRDASPSARARLVDAMLASKAFGERWGRHWLDVARFAESSGGGRSLMFPDAWRYRDWVIDSYNADLPFDRFLTEQIAGDLLPSTSDAQRNRQTIATGFLALGPTNYELQDKELLRLEVVDEQIATVGRAFMGMTLGCARCHDHKFDPVPTRDYYALAGIFGSTESLTPGNVSGWVRYELAGPETRAWHVHDQRYRKLARRLADAKSRWIAADKARAQTTRSIDPDRLEGIVLDDQDATLIGEWKLSTSVPGYVAAGYLHDEDARKGKKTATFAPQIPKAGDYELRVAYTPGSNRASNVPVRVGTAAGERLVRVDQTKPPATSGFLSLGSFRFAAGMASTITISTEDTDGHVIVDAIQLIAARRAKRAKVGGRSADLVASKDPRRTRSNARRARADAAKARAGEVVARLTRELAALKKKAPPKPPVAMAVRERASPAHTHVRVRGLVRKRGELVPRGFLSACRVDGPRIPNDASGRLELARWLTDRRHPLTTRVYVNRVWHWLFGAGLVRSCDNFGSQGERPSHPQLLDYLASRIVEEGWSTKRLVREIVLSRVYGLASSAPLQKDPENRLLSRATRRRLDADALRDAILAVSGRLDRRAGGPTISKPTQYDYGYKHRTLRRSVYVAMLRNAQLDFFEVFDGANPNLVTGRRNESQVPAQALFLLNSAWVAEQASFAAKRLLADPDLDDRGARIDRAYRLVLGRGPTRAEQQAASDHLGAERVGVHDPGGSASKAAQSGHESKPARARRSNERRWSALFHALFACLDFRYLD